MSGKRCSLCGGKLNHENVCIECGLDNGKSDKNYKVNQSGCDRKPLTHVHEESVSKKKGTGKKKKEKKTKKGKRKIAAIAVVTSIIFSLISAEDLELVLTPSEQIENTKYLSYYLY